MKKLLLLVAMLLSFGLSAQNFGNYQINVEGIYYENNPEYESWLIADGGYVTMKFRKTPVGLTHFRNLVKGILIENRMEDSEPEFDEDIIGSDVLDISNMEQINNSIIRGNSELRSVWKIGAKLMQVYSTDQGYEINFINVL